MASKSVSPSATRKPATPLNDSRNQQKLFKDKKAEIDVCHESCDYLVTPLVGFDNLERVGPQKFVKQSLREN